MLKGLILMRDSQSTLFITGQATLFPFKYEKPPMLMCSAGWTLPRPEGSQIDLCKYRATHSNRPFVEVHLSNGFIVKYRSRPEEKLGSFADQSSVRVLDESLHPVLPDRQDEWIIEWDWTMRSL